MESWLSGNGDSSLKSFDEGLSLSKKLRWYLKRAQAMSSMEMALRVRDRVMEYRWRRQYFDKESAPYPQLVDDTLYFSHGLPLAASASLPQAPVAALLAYADGLLDGHWPIFAIKRTDVRPDTDWHFDPQRGIRLADRAYSYDFRTQGEELAFDTKYAWELSRHQHTTLLATAFFVTGNENYAREAAAYVDAWVERNPFLHGLHWGSGIELGVRLVSFVWIRRLLGGWKDAAASFEASASFRSSLYAHQWLLARRMSYGSSANNHLIYEALGLFVSACAMPWFRESGEWQQRAARILEREFRAQTFLSGLNRELASDYHGFNLEALLIAGIEGDLCGTPLSDATWDIGGRMISILADLADCRGHPPRQGDGDDAHGLLLDAPDFDRWADLLSIGSVLGLRQHWWPVPGTPTLRAAIWAQLIDARRIFVSVPESPRTSVAVDAGLAVLRSGVGDEEVYCAFDAGPLGFLSIAAHGHADALSVELRVGGQPVLVDPGTFNYTTSLEWRNYFRSTAAHNTIELGGRNQSASGGPFLWMRHAKTELTGFGGLDMASSVAFVSGTHDGYAGAPFYARHDRRVSLARLISELTIDDLVNVPRPTDMRLHFHFHPDVILTLREAEARATLVVNGRQVEIVISLPQALDWTVVRGSERPILGWYSPTYDVKIPTSCLVGCGVAKGFAKFRTVFRFTCPISDVAD